MSVFKCKMCGGTIEFNPGDTVGVCDSCGTKQTLPRLDDDRRANLYDRANHFRRNNDFDKAMGIYEQILNEDSSDAEAYWSLVLCRYGIEYVEDPATHKRLPTVNRAQYTSVFADEDYKSALRCADAAQRVLYEQEAHAIDEIQKGILEISSREEPFDVFICYKETDQNGRRTPDSVLANDLYHQLTQEGFKVFFSRITLEDKLGTAYEPYIFAALNSAKVMVVLGTRPEYFNAVWVKNEWSRYLSLIKNGAKKVLIPAYRDMDPYDLPDEFSHLQAQDMSKLGFMQDLIRGIKKLAAAEAPKPAAPQAEPSVPQAGSAPLLKRAFMFLEDGEWHEADAYCEKVLDLEPECARAYLGKLMAELRVRTQAALRDCAEPFDGNGNYKKALRFADDALADDALADELRGCIRYINERNENARLEGIYGSAVKEMQRAATQQAFLAAAGKFDTIPGYQDAKALAERCRRYAEETYKDAIYSNGKAFAAQAEREGFSYRRRIDDYEFAIKEFSEIPGWRDADELAAACKKSVEKLEEQDRAEREEKERKRAAAAAEEARAAKLRKKAALLLLAGVAVVIAILLVVFQVIIPSVRYRSAEKLLAAGDYTGAAEAFGALGNYKDAKEQVCYMRAEALLETKDYTGAIEAFEALGDYKDAKEQIAAVRDVLAQAVGKAAKAYGIISAGGDHTVGLKADGTVVAAGSNDNGQCDASGWTNIIAISAGGLHTVGLKADGTVVATGSNSFHQCDVSDWTDIVAISAGYSHTVGLKADGTVIAVSNNMSGKCNVSGWTDVVAVSTGSAHTVGLKADGTVVAIGTNDDGRCDVRGWTDIIAISAGLAHTVGLKADGTVVAVGRNRYGQCDVGGWTDIVAISAGDRHTVGLKTDGTVVAVGWNGSGQCNVSDWTDIVAISAGSNHTVGLKADGTVVAVGNTEKGQCDVSGWTNIKLPG